MTTQQEKSLNRVIAEFEGWIYKGEINGRSIWQEHEDTTCQPPLYTRSLDAIVGVVQRWMEKDRQNFRAFENEIEVQYGTCCTGIADMCESKQPTLALCLAFAQAAGLDWEKE